MSASLERQRLTNRINKETALKERNEKLGRKFPFLNRLFQWRANVHADRALSASNTSEALMRQDGTLLQSFQEDLPSEELATTQPDTESEGPQRRRRLAYPIRSRWLGL